MFIKSVCGKHRSYVVVIVVVDGTSWHAIFCGWFVAVKYSWKNGISKFESGVNNLNRLYGKIMTANLWQMFVLTTYLWQIFVLTTIILITTVHSNMHHGWKILPKKTFPPFWGRALRCKLQVASEERVKHWPTVVVVDEQHNDMNNRFRH